MRFTAEEQRRWCDDGFVLVCGVFNAQTVEELRHAVDKITNGHEHNGRTYAARTLLAVPAIAELAHSDGMLDLVAQSLEQDALKERARTGEANGYAGAARLAAPTGPGPAQQARLKSVRAVRGLLFNKLPEANWAVPWHQDLTIAVCERREAPGFGPWSVKDGVVHVQPPDEVMAGMLAARIHLDDAHAANGALRVIPGSHTDGRLSAEAIGRWTTSRQAVTIEAPLGSVLLLRPHLLHASSPAESPHQRRVIHLEYSKDELPFGLEWKE